MTVPELAPPAPPAVNVDEETLKYLGYDPAKVATRTLVLLAQRYQLDPLLGEIQLVDTQQGARLYVTRDGMLAVAHRSGMLDGIDVEQRRNSTNDGWTAYVSVWRKDMGHPFRYGAQCKDTEPQAKAGNGPEMALARAERRALRRAFQIRTDFYPDRPNQELEDVDDVAVLPGVDGELATVVRSPGDWAPSDGDRDAARTVVANLPVKERIRFLGGYRIEHFDGEWPPEAVADALSRKRD